MLNLWLRTLKLMLLCTPPPPSPPHPPTLTYNRFHNVVPQEGLPLLTPSELSQLVVNRAKRTGGVALWQGGGLSTSLSARGPAGAWASVPCSCEVATG
jgi:hypothetical protein